MLTGSSQPVGPDVEDVSELCCTSEQVDGIIVALLFFLLLGCLAHACFFSPKNSLLVWFSYLRGC